MLLSFKYMNKICPICKERPVFHKERLVKTGKTIQNEDGSYCFKQDGTKTTIVKWWSCKPCTKKFSAKEYNNLFIKLSLEEII